MTLLLFSVSRAGCGSGVGVRVGGEGGVERGGVGGGGGVLVFLLVETVTFFLTVRHLSPLVFPFSRYVTRQ